jgi:hypothetical protein
MFLHGFSSFVPELTSLIACPARLLKARLSSPAVSKPVSPSESYPTKTSTRSSLTLSGSSSSSSKVSSRRMRSRSAFPLLRLFLLLRDPKADSLMCSDILSMRQISVPRTANYWLGDLSSPEFLLMEKCVSQVWNIPQTEVLRIREGGVSPPLSVTSF